MIEKIFNKLLGKRPTRILFEDIGNFSLLKEDNMKTIKIIDLLNKIANGEEVPEKIKYKGYKFVRIEGNDFLKSYIRIKSKEFLEDCTDNDDDLLFRNYHFELNDKVEILEEPKELPEKLDKKDFLDNRTIEQVDADLDFIIDKINEILDYLESEGE